MNEINKKNPALAKSSSGERGFIRSIIFIVGALVALKYFFNFDLVDLLSEGNYRAAWDGLKLYVWDKFIIDIVWSRISSWLPN
jgi:hypothetical protein